VKKFTSPKQNKEDARTAADGISRMPKAVREKVSRAIVNGADWRAVARICKEEGHPGVTAANVSNFKKGAHKEWLAAEERIEAMRRNSEETREAMRFYAEHGGNPAEAGLLAAAEMMTRAIHGMGEASFQILVAEKPQAVFQMLKELRGFAELMQRKTEDNKTEDRREDPAEQMTPEQRAAALREIFGLPSA